jgi:hypothetical protein
MDKKVYIKLDENLNSALYQLISAKIIANYQDKELIIEKNT